MPRAEKIDPMVINEDKFYDASNAAAELATLLTSFAGRPEAPGRVAKSAIAANRPR